MQFYCIDQNDPESQMLERIAKLCDTSPEMLEHVRKFFKSMDISGFDPKAMPETRGSRWMLPHICFLQNIALNKYYSRDTIVAFDIFYDGYRDYFTKQIKLPEECLESKNEFNAKIIKLLKPKIGKAITSDGQILNSFLMPRWDALQQRLDDHYGDCKPNFNGTFEFLIPK